MPKLIRDLIPDDMRSHGYEPELRIVEGEEKLKWLLEKLREETQEVIDSNGALEELADVYEVLRAIAPFCDEDMIGVMLVADAKANRRGDFHRGYLWVNSEDDSPSASSARAEYQRAEGGA